MAFAEPCIFLIFESMKTYKWFRLMESIDILTWTRKRSQKKTNVREKSNRREWLTLSKIKCWFLFTNQRYIPTRCAFSLNSKLLIIEVKLHVINSYTGQIQAYKLHGRNLYVFWVIQRRVKQYFQWKDNDNYFKQYKSVFLANLNAKAALVGFLPSLKAKNMTPSFPSYRAKR